MSATMSACKYFDDEGNMFITRCLKTKLVTSGNDAKLGFAAYTDSGRLPQLVRATVSPRGVYLQEEDGAPVRFCPIYTTDATLWTNDANQLTYGGVTYTVVGKKSETSDAKTRPSI